MSNGSTPELYLENFFKFPKDLKNDIVYCQRAFQAHIKVHQMVINVFEEQRDADPVQKQRILQELEAEIVEINAEQHYILMRLRLVLDDFNKFLNKNGIHIDKSFINAYISRVLVTLINDKNVVVRPVHVQYRLSEEKLIEKYFEVQDSNKNVFEVLDSDEEEAYASNTAYPPAQPTIDLTNNKYSPLSNKAISQESLLKPISQRLSGSGKQSPILPDPSQYLEMNLKESKYSYIDAVQTKSEGSTPPVVPESSNIKMSRMNLRQALKKAEKENLAKAAARKIARASDAAITTTTLSMQREKQLAQRGSASLGQTRLPAAKVSKLENTTLSTKQIFEQKPKPVGRPPNSTKIQKISSESSDSNTERETSPQQGNLPLEPKDTRTLPEHCGKETFLRSFGLFTPEMHLHMQQRRSKRRRRCVQSNEKADFHYERLEVNTKYGSLPPPGKKEKRRDFLLSPQLKAKKAKRGSAEKDSGPSRSTSSSPDDKNCCNECLKGGIGVLENCQECKGFYHQTCHREDDDASGSNSLSKSTDVKLCPACVRNAQKQRLAKKANHLLDMKFGRDRSKRASMQQATKDYSTRMRNLLNLVNTIKPGGVEHEITTNSE